MITRLIAFRPLGIGRQIFLIVGIEAVLILGALQMGQTNICGGDGPGYHQMALNLLDRFAVSFSQADPIEPTIYRSPGYPAFLALIYLISGRSIIAVRIAQFILLGLTAYLLYQLALRYVDRPSAKLSALLCATYPPFVFLTTYHLTESLSTFGVVGLILLIERAASQNERKYFLSFVAGATSGVLALVRPSLALAILIILPLWAISPILMRKTANIKNAALSLIIVVLGFALILSPWLIRNAILSRKLVLTSANSESLYCSMLQYSGKISYAFTAKEWESVYFYELRKRREEVERQLDSAPVGLQSGRAEIPRSVRRELSLNDNWRRGAVEEWRSLTPLMIVSSIPKRLAYLWSTCDMSPQWLQAGIFHRFTQGHFLVVVLLALLGMFLRRKSLIREWPLWVFPIYFSLIHLVFHIEPRYSIPARPFILVYSAVGAVAIFEKLRSGIVKPEQIVKG